ncbi:MULTISPECIES: CRISPR-associated endoribonuclease Cas6 [Streptococcus]
MYKKTSIKAYMRNLHLFANPEPMHLLYNISLGEKNSQDFGIFRIEEMK